MKTKRRGVFALATFFILQVSVGFSQSDDTAKSIEHIKKTEQAKRLLTVKEQKLTGELLGLLRLAEEATTSPGKKAKLEKTIRAYDDIYQSDLKSRIRICLELKSNDVAQSVISLVKSLDGEIQYVGMSAFIYCRIHPSRLRELISVDGITLITSIEQLKRNTVTTIGDIQLKTNLVRNQYNVLGAGVKIGVVSDGVWHLAEVRSAGELPFVRLIGPQGVERGDGDEGTALLEIMNDIAPAADYVFASSVFGGYQYLGDLIRQLDELERCKVIVDDLLPIKGPQFSDEDPRLGRAIRNFIARGGTFISAVGNFNYELGTVDGRRMYAGVTNFNANNLHVFPDGRTYLEFEMPPGSASLNFQWSTRWNSPTADYDVYVFDQNGNPLPDATGGTDPQHPNGTIPPLEEIRNIFNESNQVQIYRIAIRRASGDVANDFTLWCQESFLGSISGHRTYLRSATTNRKHIFGHCAYPGVIGVAAYNSDLTNQMASYSSWGDLRMFSTVANQWTVQQTPVITATSKVDTYVGQSGLWGTGRNPFIGTSAAAPHVAGIAALYFSAFPTKTRTDFFNDLTSTAVTIDGEGGGGSWARRAGYGKADALACFQRAASVDAGFPVFNPSTSVIYHDPIDVTISNSLPGSSIRYTLDGTEPTINSTLFSPSTPVRLTNSTTIKAKSFATNYQSATATAYYSFDLPFVVFESITSTRIPGGQSNVSVTITYRNQTQYQACPQM
jgi:subtilisin family serine protease